MKKISYLVVLIAAIVLIVFAQLNWTEYSTNPIFGQGAGGPKAYYPSVLYDADEFSYHGDRAKYKMWYGTSGSTTGLATSDDGISWTAHGMVMPDGYHATVEYYEDGFTGVNSGDFPSGGSMFYRMWYWDVGGTIYDVSAIGYAESPDGVNWHNNQPCINGTVPIVSGGDPWWNRGSYGPCDILYNPGASNEGMDWVFTMYYDGTTGGSEAIGLGFSSDGITWTGYDAGTDGKADPVLTGTGVSGDWDENYVSRATIIKNADDDYEMWYSGGVGAMDHGIGYATSSDGINWTKDPNPIFHKDGGPIWRNSRTYCPSVIKGGSSYKMWYTGVGSGYSIGYATAPLPVLDVEIDIKPGSDQNTINLSSAGVISVAILSSDTFDATEVDPATVTLAGTGVKMVGKSDKYLSQERDVNNDGLLDLVCQVLTAGLEIPGDSVAVLTANTFEGMSIRGEDFVRIVPDEKL